MIIGIGCDIISIRRIKDIITKWEDKFLNRIFSEEEIACANSKGENYYSYLAKRFAAKEALSKALQTGIGAHFSFKDCEVLNNTNGAPYFKFYKPLPYKIHLSLSDEKDYAQAFVIIE